MKNNKIILILAQIILYKWITIVKCVICLSNVRGNTFILNQNPSRVRWMYTYNIISQNIDINDVDETIYLFII